MCLLLPAVVASTFYVEFIICGFLGVFCPRLWVEEASADNGRLGGHFPKCRSAGFMRARCFGRDATSVFLRLSGDAFAKASDKLPSVVENSKAVMKENALVAGAMVSFASDWARNCALKSWQWSGVDVRTKVLLKSGIST